MDDLWYLGPFMNLLVIPILAAGIIVAVRHNVFGGRTRQDKVRVYDFSISLGLVTVIECFKYLLKQLAIFSKPWTLTAYKQIMISLAVFTAFSSLYTLLVVLYKRYCSGLVGTKKTLTIWVFNFVAIMLVIWAIIVIK